jgi:glutamine amidotransferase-like uncharacterized protein
LSKVEVALFSGVGAVLFPEVLNALQGLNLQHDLIDEVDVENRLLRLYKVLIVPGGYTEECVKGLSEKARSEIRSFVGGGGSYIGICMGAYIASNLKLTKALLIRRRGEYIVEVAVTNPNHPIMAGYKGKVAMHYQNGPEMIAQENDEVLATFPSGKAAILTSKHGLGKVILFSPHPERLRSTWIMMENAVKYCLV